jgi:Uncharacterised nucleotidyltransferase
MKGTELLQLKGTEPLQHLKCEELLLVGLCSAAVAGELPPKPTKMAGRIDWERFVALARDHRVVPMLHGHLRSEMESTLPRSVTRIFRADHERNGLDCLRVSSQLIRVMEALNKEEIRSLPLKGVCLASRYYNNVMSRHVGDIDLLISLDKIVQADSTIRDLGYSRVSNETHMPVGRAFSEDPRVVYHYFYLGPDRTLVELHFRLHPNPAILPIDAETLAERREVVVSLGGASIPVLPDRLQLIFLATHGARHRWSRLQWLCDFALLSRDSGLGGVAAAEEYKLLNPLAQGFILAQRLLGVAVPKEMAAAYSPSLPIRYLVKQAEGRLLRGDEGHGSDAVGNFRLRERLNERIYKACMTGDTSYHWNELKRAVRRRVSRDSLTRAHGCG